MTIDEAIKASEEAIIFLAMHHQERLASGVKLGIEAVKRVKELRRFDGISHQRRLLGETEE